MKKETFQDKLIKRFYGIAGPLDEFRQKEASRLGNTCFILLFGAPWLLPYWHSLYPNATQKSLPMATQLLYSYPLFPPVCI